jgi:hypothetical protein
MDDEWRTGIFDCLGSLLHGRDLTRERYDATIKKIHSRFALDGDNRQVDWGDLESAIVALNKEAVALEALIISYKASAVK